MLLLTGVEARITTWGKVRKVLTCPCCHNTLYTEIFHLWVEHWPEHWDGWLDKVARVKTGVP